MDVLNPTHPDRYDTELEEYRQARVSHWDALAGKLERWKGWGGQYHRLLERIYQFLIAPGQRVLEIGCGRGDLLASLRPSDGVGVDFSGEMARLARSDHPELTFVQQDVHHLDLNGTYDVVIFSDLLNDLWDIQAAFQEVACHMTPRSRIVINSYSRLWESVLALAEKLNLAKPLLYQNWLTVEDVVNLLNLTGFELIRSWTEILWPLPTPLWGPLCNRFLVKVWPFRFFGLTNFIVARPRPQNVPPDSNLRVSVIIPARNEAGNIASIFKRVPDLGAGTELIFVEGHSLDDTYALIEREIAAHPERKCKLLKQTGTGKGDAVRSGFAGASGDILMILDADLTVPPEELTRFYKLLDSGQAEMVNGVRLVYPMEDQAMRFFNLLGNKFFSLAFSWLLGQPIKDTLCGTKALWKRDYERIVANRAYFGEFDPFGDFDLLFGAAKLNLKIVDLPIRYRKRTYGTTNIQRWKHGWLLLRMVIFAARKIKFV